MNEAWPAPDIWTARIWAEYRAGNLTRAWRDVLITLRTFRGHGGIAWPSHATLADRAGCCVRTVQRALQQGRELGLVSWMERRVRAGWRWLRTSNAYRLLAPTAAVVPGRKPDYIRPDAQESACPDKTSLTRKEALLQMLREANAMPDLLARRREAFSANTARERERESTITQSRSKPMAI